jgi:hypothetical protein
VRIIYIVYTLCTYTFILSCAMKLPQSRRKRKQIKNRLIGYLVFQGYGRFIIWKSVLRSPVSIEIPIQSMPEIHVGRQYYKRATSFYFFTTTSS